jgi:hypothetical protein
VTGGQDDRHQVQQDRRGQIHHSRVQHAYSQESRADCYQR